MKLSYLYGTAADDWLRLLRDNGFRLSPGRLPQAFLITLMSLHNLWLRRKDARIALDGAAVRAPLFILGHWRSGTTHLQYILSRDPRFASPSTYEVCFPGSLLCSEHTHGKLLAPFVPKKRPQDGMTLGMGAPNEDEIALAALGLPSPYLFLAFPRRERHYRRFLSFREADPSERETFKRGLDAYLRKLTKKHDRTLLLKSPTHTARVALLLSLYPDARFVHISRHPYEVFRSTRHLHRIWFDAFAFIQEFDRRGMDERILAIYCDMYDAYFRDRAAVPPGQMHAMRFEDLEADPMTELEKLYAALGLSDFPSERFEQYLKSVRSYRKNSYPPLEPAARNEVARRWRRSFESWGYSPDAA